MFSSCAQLYYLLRLLRSTNIPPERSIKAAVPVDASISGAATAANAALLKLKNIIIDPMVFIGQS